MFDDASSDRGRPGRLSPAEHAALWQRVLNASWPLHDRQGNAHARGIPDRPGIAVLVRIVWERDGEEWARGTAKRWTRTHVCVLVGDQRLQTPYLWVRASDVVRAAASPTTSSSADDP